MEEDDKVKNENSRYAKNISRSLIILLGIAILIIFKVASKIFLPLVISFFCYLLISPLLKKLEKIHIPKGLSVLIGMIVMAVILIIVTWGFLIVVNMLISKLPAYGSRLEALDELMISFISEYVELPEQMTITKLFDINWISIAMQSLSSLSAKTIAIVKDVGLIYIFVFFLMLEGQSLVPKMKVAFPQEGEKISSMIGKIGKQTSKYLMVKGMISAVTGLLFFATAYVVGLDFAFLWGILAFVLNFIPSIGSVIVTILVILMSIIQFAPNWMPVLYVAVLCISIEMVLGNVIDPRLQGVQLNLSPFVILVSLSLWGYVWGVMGMFLAVPITSIIQIVCANIPAAKPFAILLCSGNSYLRQEQKKKRRTRKRKEKDDNPSSEGLNDYIMPSKKES